MNNILNILDGAMAIDNSRPRGTFELYYVRDEKRIRVNDLDGLPLSEIFRSR